MKGSMVTKKETPPSTTEDPWGVEQGFSTEAPVIEFPNERDFLTVTLKAGGGYDAPWLVAHANSVEEALEFLQHEQLDELMDLTARKAKELARAFGGAPVVAKPAVGASSGYKKPVASGGSTDLPEDNCPAHNCPLVHVEGFTNPKTGKTISARVACPVPNCRKLTYWQEPDGSWTRKEQ